MAEPLDVLYEISKTTIGVAVFSLAGVFTWLGRLILANQRQLDLIKQEIEGRAELAAAIEAERSSSRIDQMRRFDQIDDKLNDLNKRIDEVIRYERKS